MKRVSYFLIDIFPLCLYIKRLDYYGNTGEDGISFYMERRLCPVAFEEMEKGSWINCAAPDAAELEKLNALTGIPVDSLQTALDREERAHVELEDDFIFVVVNTPVVLETDAYDALPLGIFITDKVFVTVCLENNTVIQKFINNNYASFHTYK